MAGTREHTTATPCGATVCEERGLARASASCINSNTLLLYQTHTPLAYACMCTHMHALPFLPLSTRASQTSRQLLVTPLT